MKKIKLVQYTAPDYTSILVVNHSYQVSLGNGYKIAFENKKETLTFLSETSRILNVKMFELNFLFSEIMRAYRHAWPYYENGKGNGMNNFQGILGNKIQWIESAFNLLVDRAGYQNGNYTVFSNLYLIIDELKSICEHLLSLYAGKGYTVTQYELESFKTRLEYVYTSIAIYPQKIELVKERTQFQAVLKVVS